MPKGEHTKKLWQNPEYRERMSLVHKGKKPVNIETLVEMNKSTRGHRDKQIGNVPWNKGKKMPQVSGEKHYLWIEDRTKLKSDSGIRRGISHKVWSKKVKDRDNWKCKISNQDCKGSLEAHHILSWKDYPELRYEINNGITLSKHHHPRKKKDEIQLAPFFNNLINNIN